MKHNLLKLAGTAAFLLAGGMANSAMAATPTVTPAEGTVTSLDQISLIWGETVTEGANFENGVTMTYTGGTPEFDPVWELCDVWGNPDWGWGDPMEGLLVTPSNWVNMDGDNTAYTVTLKVAAGTVNVEGVPNEEISLTYKVVEFNNEIVREPNGTVSSISTFRFKWEAYDEIAFNPEMTDAQITYNWMPVAGSKIEDGWVVVDLGEKYSEQGWLNIDIPEGMFLITTPDGPVPNPYGSFVYIVQAYTVDPAFGTVDAPFDSFTIYASESIELVGDLSKITVRGVDYDYDPNGSEGIIATAVSSAEVEGPNGEKGIKVTFDNPVEEASYVYVVIPGNMFEFNGEKYAANIQLEYMVTLPLPAPDANPASGSTVPQLDEITLSWGTSAIETYWEFETAGSKIELSFNGGEPVDITDKVSVENDSEMTDFGWPINSNGRIVIDFGDEPYTEEGTYVIVIPEKYVSVEDFENQTNGEIILTYTVEAGVVDLMDPATYETLEGNPEYLSSFNTVTLTWDYEPITLNEDVEVSLVYNGGEKVYPMKANVVYLPEEEVPGEPATGLRAVAPDNDNALVLSVVDDMENPFWSAPGVYTIDVPQGLVMNNNGMLNPQQTITLTVVELTTIVPTVTPETDVNGLEPTTVKELSEVTITWNECPLAYNGGEIRVIDPEGNSYDVVPTNENGVLTLDLSEIVEADGLYEVLISEGAYVITEESGKTLCGMVDLQYTVSKDNGAAAVEAQGGYKVYSIDGVNVLNTESKDAVNNLAPGLYIINGKKVLVRK